MVQRTRHGRARVARSNRFRRLRTYKVTCSGCGNEVTTPVPPPDDKKLLCMECFNKSGISKEVI